MFFWQDLENRMRKHPESRLRNIQNIGQCLMKEDIMSEKMKTDMDTVTNRWNKLSQQVSCVKHNSVCRILSAFWYNKRQDKIAS